MITKTHFLAAVFAALLLTACSRPFVLIPGGALVGQSAPAPQSWSFTDAIDTIQLETNPADPYSVNIWVVGMGNALYVHAGANRATWIENMDADPNVRLQAGDTIYELAASRVTSQEEFDRYSAPYEEKYGNPPRNLNVVEAYLYRLVAR
ncbi:MAG: nitroreductase family deazaflavin-dependent oxidoreductase [Proteobacteria bacterium]|jgi:hypothetical protein|nr:nitroreductase family deazaflavin-dependent oxidoreductase [Pseudomonadota bacterium]